MGSTGIDSPPSTAKPELPRHSSIGKILAEWGWLFGIIGGPVLTALFAYLTRIDVTNESIQALLGVAGLWWFIVLIIWLVWIEGAIASMLRTQGRSCSVFEELWGTRDDIMGEIHKKVHELPRLDDETLEDVDFLVQAAGVAKALTDGVNRAMGLRLRLLAGLIVVWPLTIFVGIFVGDLTSTLQNAVLVAVTTFFVGYVSILLVISGDLGRSLRWASRVHQLVGENRAGVRRKVEQWSEGRRD